MSRPGLLGELVGFAAVLLLIVVAMRFPKPSRFQVKTLTIAIALLVAMLAARMPGLLKIEIPGAQATGAWAVLLIVLTYGLRMRDRE